MLKETLASLRKNMLTKRNLIISFGGEAHQDNNTIFDMLVADGNRETAQIRLGKDSKISKETLQVIAQQNSNIQVVLLIGASILNKELITEFFNAAKVLDI